MKTAVCIMMMLCGLTVFGQDVVSWDWKKIVPLSSTCSDVKRILSVDECRFPRTEVKKGSMEIVIHFSTADDNWAVANDIVTHVSVVLNDLLRLKDFEKNLRAYTVIREADSPEVEIYTNATKGIRLSVQTAVAKEPYISSIFLFPSKEMARRFKRKRSY